MSAVVSKATKRRSGFLKVLGGSPVMGPLVALILASIFFAFKSDKFLTGANFSLILQQVVVVGTLAIGQTLIILTSGIDLSNGAIMALSGVLMSSLAADHGVPPLLAVLIGIGVAVTFGLINGSLVTGVRLPAFIVTLGVYNIAFALTRIYTTATITGLPDLLLFLGNTFRVGSTEITYGSVLMILMYALTWFILRSTPAGRSVYAVGDNPEAARLAGINTSRVLVGVYTMAGLTYGIAALMLVARTGVGDPQSGQTAALESITAVVLGGTSLFGGRGTIIGTLIGALIVGVFRNGLQLMGVESTYQILITGILVIAAVSVDQLSHRGK